MDSFFIVCLGRWTLVEIIFKLIKKQSIFFSNFQSFETKLMWFSPSRWYQSTKTIRTYNLLITSLLLKPISGCCLPKWSDLVCTLSIFWGQKKFLISFFLIKQRFDSFSTQRGRVASVRIKKVQTTPKAKWPLPQMIRHFNIIQVDLF